MTIKDVKNDIIFVAFWIGVPHLLYFITGFYAFYLLILITWFPAVVATALVTGEKL